MPDEVNQPTPRPCEFDVTVDASTKSVTMWFPDNFDFDAHHAELTASCARLLAAALIKAADAAEGKTDEN